MADRANPGMTCLPCHCLVGNAACSRLDREAQPKVEGPSKAAKGSAEPTPSVAKVPRLASPSLCMKPSLAWLSAVITPNHTVPCHTVICCELKAMAAFCL